MRRDQEAVYHETDPMRAQSQFISGETKQSQPSSFEMQPTQHSHINKSSTKDSLFVSSLLNEMANVPPASLTMGQD